MSREFSVFGFFFFKKRKMNAETYPVFGLGRNAIQILTLDQTSFNLLILIEMNKRRGKEEQQRP